MQEQWQFTLGRQGSQAFQIRRDAAAETQRSPAIQPIPRPNTSNPSRKYPKLRHFERERVCFSFFSMSCDILYLPGCNGCESAHDFLHFAPAPGRHRRVHFRSYKGHVSGSPPLPSVISFPGLF